MFRRMRLAGRIGLVAAYLTFGWLFGLALVVWWFLATVRAFLRARRALAAFTRCPRGHTVAQFGVFRCTCGAVSEGWAWICPICRQESGYVDCDTCGRAVRNPRLG